MRFASSIVALAGLTAVIAAPSPAAAGKQRLAAKRATTLSPTELLDSITSELTSTTATINSTASSVVAALAGTTKVATGGLLGNLLGGLLGGSSSSTASSVNLDTVTNLLDDIVEQVTDLQSTLEGLVETGTTVTQDLASVSSAAFSAASRPASLIGREADHHVWTLGEKGQAAEALASLVSEVQSVIDTVTDAASSVPGLGSIAGSFTDNVQDPLSAVTSILSNLIPGLLDAVQTL